MIQEESREGKKKKKGYWGRGCGAGWAVLLRGKLARLCCCAEPVLQRRAVGFRACRAGEERAGAAPGPARQPCAPLCWGLWLRLSLLQPSPVRGPGARWPWEAGFGSLSVKAWVLVAEEPKHLGFVPISVAGPPSWLGRSAAPYLETCPHHRARSGCHKPQPPEGSDPEQKPKIPVGDGAGGAADAPIRAWRLPSASRSLLPAASRLAAAGARRRRATPERQDRLRLFSRVWAGSRLGRAGPPLEARSPVPVPGLRERQQRGAGRSVWPPCILPVCQGDVLCIFPHVVWDFWVSGCLSAPKPHATAPCNPQGD